MTAIHETINLDAREVYEEPIENDKAIGHSPLCECEGCENFPPYNGYADAEQQEYYESLQDDGEAVSGPLNDLSDDAEALASAGWGTDEDYGYYGDD